MILFPRKTKYKKYQKQKRKFKVFFKEYKYNFPKTFFFGLKIKNNLRIFSYHLETIKNFIKRKIKKKENKKLFFGFFPDLSITKKSSGLRMGKGKGNVFAWTSILNKGRIFCELPKKLTYVKSKYLIVKASNKLSGKCKFIKKKKIN